MGAIVTIKIPPGMSLDGIKDVIQKAVSDATGEPVSVVVNAISQVQRRKIPGVQSSTGTPQSIQGQGVTVPNSIPGSEQ